MEALAQPDLPVGSQWVFEPKWDGFRCVAFKDGAEVQLQSKAGQPLGRYFPELVKRLQRVPVAKFVLDGEILIVLDKKLSFDLLLQRIHPAASRVLKLSAETPATFVVFDLLSRDGVELIQNPFSRRRAELEKFHKKYLSVLGNINLSPQTGDLKEARRWFREMRDVLDGVVAKDLTAPYESGKRSGVMQKIKNIRTADCVVGGFRYASKGSEVGSLLLGLYDERGLLDHVGFTASFSRPERKKLRPLLVPLIKPPGFTGNAPGGPSRWSTKRTSEWQPLSPTLVVEVQYDHFTGDRFRHGTKLLRWRTDKKPRQCTLAQVRHESVSPLEFLQ
jgi:ATP-dependent DNA ligase